MAQRTAACSSRGHAGVEGGFDAGVPQFVVDTAYAIVVLPEFVAVPLDDPAVPERVCGDATPISIADIIFRCC